MINFSVVEKSGGFSFIDKKSTLYVLSVIVIIGYVIDILVSDYLMLRFVDFLSIVLALISIVLELFIILSTKKAFSIILYNLTFCVFLGYFSKINTALDSDILHSSLIIAALMPFAGYVLGKKHILYIGNILMLFNSYVLCFTENKYVSQNIHMLALLLIGYILGIYYLISLIEKGDTNQLNFIAKLKEQNSDNIFLKNLSFKLATFSGSEDIVPTMLKSIKEHTQARLAMFSVYDQEKKVLLIKSIVTNETIFNTIKSTDGIEILNTPSQVISRDSYLMMASGNIYTTNSLNEVTFGAISKINSNEIQKLTKLTTLYRIAHLISDQLYGTTILAFEKHSHLPTNSLLESYSHLAALSIRKNLAEKALHESEAKLRHITNQISDVIFTADLKLNTTYISPSIEKMTGETTDSYLKKNLKEKYPPKSLRKIRSVLKEELEKDRNPKIDKNRTRLVDLEYYKADGNIIFTSAHISFIRNSNGIPIGIQGVIRDISKRTEAENALKKQEQKLKTIIETIPDLLFQLDNTGRFTSFFQTNKYDKLYKQPSEFLNKTVHDIFEPNLADKLQEAIIQTLNKNNYELEYEMGVDELKYFISRFARINNNEILAVVSDITEKKQKEKQLKRYSEDLKQLVADKDRFMQIISHDLRSPFQTLLGFSELLIQNLADYKNEEIQNYLGLIQQTSQKTYNLLTNLLFWSNAQSGKLHFEPQKMLFQQECKRVIEELQANTQKKNISIHITKCDNIYLWADKNMTRTILRNLISNAIKFSYQGGQINISCEKQYHMITVRVADTGVGISKENQHKLWNFTNPFTTYGTSKEQGTGLGLLLCKEFIEKHKGKIWVESESGKGSVFIFELPVKNT